jgi:hypothetical protein
VYRLISKYNSKKQRLEYEMNLTGLEQVPIVGSCKDGNGPFGSMKSRDFLKKLRVAILSTKGLCYM